MKSAIAVINYQSPKFLQPQISRIKEHLQPDSIVVFDTSKDDSSSHIIASICRDLAVSYVRIKVHDFDSSISHATGLNFAYNWLRDKFDIIGFLDHDCFPFASFPWKEYAEKNTFMTVPQMGTYPHPGYCFINVAKAGELNWLPCEGKDTGGRIELKDCHVLSHKYEPEPEHEIIGGFLMHFIKGSAWHKPEVKEHKKRITKLFEILGSK